VKVALYARVSTERQQERGTISSQLDALRAAAEADGHEVIEEFIDDGYSGSRLDRPALDRLRDAAEAGVLDGVICLAADRLARAYAYQVLIIEELARFGVSVRFLEGPAHGEDPQATLLVQMQGVIAEYERAKIAERYRRGKLYRARQGEIPFWKTSYGHRRVVPAGGGPARIEVFEPEAEIVRFIFDAYVEKGRSIRQIAFDLLDRGIPSPTGKPVWGTSTITRLLNNEAYIGTVYYNRREHYEGNAPRGARNRKTRSRERPREEWIPIPVQAIIGRETFDRVKQVKRDNSKWNPRGAEWGVWLLRGLIECGHCHLGCNCHRMRGRNGTWHRYYYCRGHDPLRTSAGKGRCPERNIRADELDEYVFAQVRQALLDPKQLIAAEHAVIAGAPADENELVAAQLKRLESALQSNERERARLLDAYQAGLLELDELTRRTAAITARRDQLTQEKNVLTRRSAELATENRLRRRLAGFAEQVAASLDDLDVEGRRRLLRLVVEKVRVTGWRVEIHLKIPLPEDPPDDDPPGPAPEPNGGPSSDMRLRSLGGAERRQLPPTRQRTRRSPGRETPRNRLTDPPRCPRRGPQNASQRVAPTARALPHELKATIAATASPYGLGLATTVALPSAHPKRASSQPAGWSTFQPARAVQFSTGLDMRAVDRGCISGASDHKQQWCRVDSPCREPLSLQRL
jgi:site-specific DNA recombinase